MTLDEIDQNLHPLGHLADGTPFWAYFGAGGEGSDDGDDGADGDGDDDGDEGDDEGSEDGDDGEPDENGHTAKGRTAIERERKSNKALREKVKPWNALQRELGMTPDEIRAAVKGKTSTKGKTGNKDDDGDGVDADEIRRQATAEATAKVNDRLIKSAVRTLAAEVLNDPKDAVRFLDLSDYEVDDDGDVDEAQVKADLRALLKDKPYLGKARKGDGRTGGSPDFDGGSRKTSTKTSMSDVIRRQAGVIK